MYDYLPTFFNLYVRNDNIVLLDTLLWIVLAFLMEYYKLILPEHLNHKGKLFGGNTLKWIDEFAYITASQEFPGNNFLTIALDNVVFRKAVSLGEIMRFVITLNYLGRTSVQYNVRTFGTRENDDVDEVLFETRITFVAVDENGTKTTIKTRTG